MLECEIGGRRKFLTELLGKIKNCQLYFKKSNCILFKLYGFSKVILQLTWSELISCRFH